MYEILEWNVCEKNFLKYEYESNFQLILSSDKWITLYFDIYYFGN
jgi:hypothetical protein